MSEVDRRELGVNQVAERIHGRLRRYLEAQYHIRDTHLIAERRGLLAEPGAIAQVPFVEATPSYAVSEGYTSLKLPAAVRQLLDELSGWEPGVGVYPPYKHQADALEAFFSAGDDGNDLIVATGTGSGKTETFLYSILGSLALEGSERPESFQQHGVRALMLYPMNALVSDQTSRLRSMLGAERLATYFRNKWGRQAWFGMYTSRTPYPGVRKSARDQREIQPLLTYFNNLEVSSTVEDQRLVKELKERGRWPAKDIPGFLGLEHARTKQYGKGARKGQAYTQHNWDERLVTQPEDRELLTRHEIQAHPPDLLVTNYSMLEYMLLRPLERPIFAQTKTWLEADQRNRLLLVLDEAHMYRGVGGAEVGLLIRRLQSRLGITRDRLRVILTSASLGSGPASQVAVLRFAEGLCGQRKARPYALIRGTREVRTPGRPGTDAEAEALSKLRPSALAGANLDIEPAREDITILGAALGWPSVGDPEAGEQVLRQLVTTCMNGWGPLERLLEICAGNATAFDALAKALFPSAPAPLAGRAADALLALGAFARRCETQRTGQPLVPTRVHMLFRGLPPIYVCINPECSARRTTDGGSTVAGRLYTEARTHCECGARVFELLTHRDCGTAYARVFGVARDTDFFWHERGGALEQFGQPLHEIHVLLEEPHKLMNERVVPIWLDVLTGRVFRTPPMPSDGTRVCYLPADPDQKDARLSTFPKCPVCTRMTRTGGTLKIMDLSTKGEQPFANVVREQFVSQVATRTIDEVHPNGGRKALLFSDGRQKAARLARDLPREVERDSFREAIVLAASLLDGLGLEATLDERLYAAFIAVCTKHHLHFFDQDAQEALIGECQRFRKNYDAELVIALDDEWRPTPPSRYRAALLRQVADPYYSLAAACAAVVQPRKAKTQLLSRKLQGELPDDPLRQVAGEWVRTMIGRGAFDPNLSLDARQDAWPFFEPVRPEEGLKGFFEDVMRRTGLDAPGIRRLREALNDVFVSSVQGDAAGALITPDSVTLELAVDATWLQCAQCGQLQLRPFIDGCNLCGARDLQERPVMHPYMVSRKGFFRDPLRAVLNGERPVHITAEEHTAQLSQRETGDVYATTEEFELRFQDVPLGVKKPPIDVLSCTTTMEVGVDIGSLTAVGLRTVPPQRENYQQRAGRAGRRGSAVSSVVTFAQGGAHDAFYFARPEAMISGPPRDPRIKSDNRRLARRHIHSYLLQTFFNMQLDKAAAGGLGAQVVISGDIMSAFGLARDFFRATGPFTLSQFEEWLRAEVLQKDGSIGTEIAGWLPRELFAGAADEKRETQSFIRDVGVTLLELLREMGKGVSTSASDVPGGVIDEDEERKLLDLLFDAGILPSYAFPTDLCSLTIQEREDGGKVKLRERPQMGKAQALSEYAPGRLVVVNKRTYRIGGIFVDGIASASPATSLFARPLTRYVGCARCGFVRLERQGEAAAYLDGVSCPVCTAPLHVREVLDPPGFSPEHGRELREGDRDQEITYASSAQLPELVGQEAYVWRRGEGSHLEYAYGEQVLLVVANKGKDSEGFVVCEACGAAWPMGEEPAGGSHGRPFLLPSYVLRNEGATRACSGTLRKRLFLGHEFRTDILILRIPVVRPFDFSPEQPWLYDALATLAEALALGASLHLDIDPGELSAGFRLRAGQNEVAGIAELYLFDTASGGAGYAAEAGEDLAAVLERAEALLRDCEAGCQRSCTKCLRHYGNRFLHERLDRRLGLALLKYARKGEVGGLRDISTQATELAPLGRLVELNGWRVEANAEDRGQRVPLVVTRPGGSHVIVGTYPALLERSAAEATHGISQLPGRERILLPDYLVEHDLPSAFQCVLDGSHLPGHGDGAQVAHPPSEVTTVRGARIQDIIDGNDGETSQEVRVMGSVPADAYVVRPPSNVLASLGFPESGWLVVTRGVWEDGDTSKWWLIGRRGGTFGATREGWTVAHVRSLQDSAGERLQLSYGRTESQFRPERIDCGDIRVVGEVVNVLAAASH